MLFRSKKYQVRESRTYRPKDQLFGHCLSEFDPIQADRLEDWAWAEIKTSRQYLKGITGVWGILRRELAHERIM